MLPYHKTISPVYFTTLSILSNRYRGISVLEKSLEVTDNSSKLEDENASSYSAYFQLDNLPPSKKGTRESVSLHVKVNIASDPSLCHTPTVVHLVLRSVHLLGLIADFPDFIFSIFMDLSHWRLAVSQCLQRDLHTTFIYLFSSSTAATNSPRLYRSKSTRQIALNTATGARPSIPSNTNATLTSRTTASRSSKTHSDEGFSWPRPRMDKGNEYVFDLPTTTITDHS